MSDGTNPHLTALELAKAIKEELAAVRKVAKSEVSPVEAAKAVAAGIRAQIEAHREELVKMRKLEVQTLKKSVHGIPSSTPSAASIAPPPSKSVFDILHSNAPGVQKTEDFISVSNDNDPEKRIVTVGGKGTVLPKDKKSKRVDAPGSGGEIQKDVMSDSSPAPSGSSHKPAVAPTLKPTGIPGAKVGAAPSAPKPPVAPGAAPTMHKDEADSAGDKKATGEVRCQVCGKFLKTSEKRRKEGRYLCSVHDNAKSANEENDLSKSIFDILASKKDVVGQAVGQGAGGTQFGLSPQTAAGTPGVPSDRNSFGTIPVGAKAASPAPWLPGAETAFWPTRSTNDVIGMQVGQDAGLSHRTQEIAPYAEGINHEMTNTATQRSPAKIGAAVRSQTNTNRNAALGGDMGFSHPVAQPALNPAPMATVRPDARSSVSLPPTAKAELEKGFAGPKLGGKDGASQAMTSAAHVGSKPAMTKPTTTVPPTMKEHAAREASFKEFMPPGGNTFGKEEFDAEDCPYCKTSMGKCHCD